ncbi:class F sortase [Pseudonocardia sp. GCM10023141]|uniref:class F sortase n=1 Tax=Pseudonocardia sp. GCM10023141 TaxID=3252653 RepID=UPI00360C127E
MNQPQVGAGPGRRARVRGWWAATAVLLIGAAALLVGGVRGHDDALSSLSPAASPATSVATPAPPDSAAAAAPPVAAVLPGDGATAAPPGTAAIPLVQRSVPTGLRIPAIGLSVPVSGLGLNPDGTVEVPTDFQKAGWFEQGPSPGQIGSAVILGHVDSYQGPAAFYRLRTLKAGDDVEVGLADGGVARFVVDSVAMYPKEQFPAQQVYGSHGGRALQLVTCGGEFDSAARSYLSNVVVYTTLAAMTPGRPSTVH